MDGYDFNLLQKTQEKAEYLRMSIRVQDGDLILEALATGAIFGRFESVEQVYAFLCGYDWGISNKIKGETK